MTVHRRAGRTRFLTLGSVLPALPRGRPRMTFLEDAARYGERGRTARGARMLRATVWTVGLFGAGTAICRAFPWTWTDPLVLFGLGIALLFVSSARTARDTRPSTAARPVATLTQASTTATVAPVAAAVQVERTA